MSNVRSPAVAGQFYAGDAESLRTQIADSFTHPVGPGAVPEVGSGGRPLFGLVSPHAGYPYSGPVAAHGFAAVVAAGAPETVVVLGPNHSGFGADVALPAAETWETPLGEVPVDAGLRDALADAVDAATVDDRAHDGEHSIEVQLPFLQYLFDDGFGVLPVCLKRQDLETARDLGASLAEVVDDETLVVASTDLTHYEPHDAAEAADRRAIESMETLDSEGLLDLVTREGHSMCGYGAVAATMVAANARGATDAELFAYATSGDTAGSKSQVVGYCSLGYYR